MRRRILLKIFLILLTLVVLYLILSWAGTITQVRLVHRYTTEASMLPVAQQCIDSFVGKSLWSISDVEVRATVSACDVTFSEVKIHHLFPRKLEVEITMFQPVIKVLKQDSSCILLMDSSKHISLPSDRCITYLLPVLTGPGVESNVFVQEYATELARALTPHGIVAKSIEYKGDAIAPWYVIELLAGGRAYFPSSAAITDKVVILAASLKGLNAAKERYSIVDVRFDRVVYK